MILRRSPLSSARRLILVAATVAAVAAAGLGAGGWHYSERIRDAVLDRERGLPQFNLEIDGIRGDTVTLRSVSATPDPRWKVSGLWGITGPTGYDQIGDVVEDTERGTVRRHRPLRGSLRPGDRVRIDSDAYPENPRVAFGAAFEEVQIPAKIGLLPAWSVGGSRDVWVIAVHGRSGRRSEMLRSLRVPLRLGFPCLVPAYRNDVDAPASIDGWLRYGDTEWEDLEAAVRFAIGRGATSVVLMGHSLGGGIVTNFLYRSPLAGRVAGVVLDAPVLDLGEVVSARAAEMDVPQPLAVWGKAVAGWRFGLDWGRLNYLSRAAALRAPVLLFHGDADPTVPVAHSDALAAARPELVTYVRVPGALHAQSWNASPDRYEAAVQEFLTRVAGPP